MTDPQLEFALDETLRVSGLTRDDVKEHRIITTPDPTLPVGAQLRSIVERIERASEERDAIASDIRDIYAEAAANGFDAKALRTIVRLRKQDANEREEFESILDLYMSALGMLPAGDGE